MRQTADSGDTTRTHCFAVYPLGVRRCKNILTRMSVRRALLEREWVFQLSVISFFTWYIFNSHLGDECALWKEMLYLPTQYAHFIYGYIALDIWLMEGWKEGNVLFNDALNAFYLRLYGVGHMVKDHSDSERETCCSHIGYSFRVTARILLYAPSHRQDSTYHGPCYTSRGELAGTRNSSMGPP